LQTSRRNNELENQMIQDKTASEMGLAVVAVVFALIVFPLVIFSIPFFILMRIIKSKKVHYTLLILGILMFGFVMLHDYKYFFGMYVLIPSINNFIESVFSMKNDLALASYLLYIGGGSVVAFVFNIFTEYYRSRLVNSKEDEILKEKESKNNQKVYKNRFKINERVQNKWRKDVKSNKTDQLLCGISESGKPYYMDFKEINQHAFVCATTGGGKTILLLNMVEYALMKDYPFIFIDGKGSHESIDEVDSLCEKYDRHMNVFSDISNLTYNPIKHGNSTIITDKLQHLVDTESEYYVMVNKTLVQTIIQFLDAFDIKRDLWNFAKYLDPAQIKKVLNRDSVTSFEEPKQEYGSFLDGESGNDKSEVKRSDRSEWFYEKFFGRWKESEEGELYLFENASTVRMALYGLVDSDLGHLFKEKENGLDLIKLSENKEGLFISLDGNVYDDYIKKIARFIISDINYLVSYRNKTQQKDNPILAIYDEFSVYANDKIVDTVNKSRSAGFHCVIATQTLADLDKVDKSLKNQIVGNTNTYMVGQTNNPNEVDEWSNNFGTYKDIDVTTVTQRRKGRLKRVDFTGDQGTIRRVDKFKVNPNVIRGLRTGEFVFARKASLESIDPNVVYVRNPLKWG